jgi:pimeloyl-ACP methyl ester carboxylesterase
MHTITSPTGTAVQPQRARRKRGFFFWTRRVLLVLVIALVALGGAGAVYQAVATALDQRAYPPPGQLVDVGGYKLHISCSGTGSPTVILEAGLANPSSIWGWIQPEVAKSTRVCAYDRAGVGWSDPGPEPRDAQQIVRELHTLLSNAHIPGPYILVGHSYGGKYVRVYAAAYPSDVAGMVLVDAGHPDQWTRTPQGQAEYTKNKRLNYIAPWLARFGILRVFNFFPLNHDLPSHEAAVYKAFVDSTEFALVNRAEFDATLDTDAQTRAAGNLGRLPLYVLTATDHGYATGNTTSDAQLSQFQHLEQLWQDQQHEFVLLSSNSVQSVVQGASHASLQIKQTDAQATIEAIRQVVEAARTGQPVKL